MRYIVPILLAAMACTTGVVLYYLFLEPPWLSYRNIPFEPMVRQVHAGEVIPLRVSRCSTASTKRTYRFSHSLVRADEPNPATFPIILPDTVVSIDPGCIDVISMANTVPAHTPAGRYYAIGIVELQGTFRQMLVEWHSQTFEVIPP